MSDSTDPTRRYIIIGMIAVAYVMTPLLLMGLRDMERWDAEASTLSPLALPHLNMPFTEPIAPPAPPPAPATPPVAMPKVAPLAVPEDEPLPETIPDPPKGAEVVERKWEDLTFRFVRTTEGDNFHGKLEIFVGPRRAYSIEAYRFLMPDETEGRVPPLGQDITGNGAPDFILKEWTGGAACCFLYHVFEWKDGNLTPIATLDAAYTEFSVFRDVDGDGIYEFITNDWTFAQWKTDLAQSPAPQIILYYAAGEPKPAGAEANASATATPSGGGGGYHLALHLMNRPKPTEAQFEAAAQRVREMPEWRETVPPAFWAETLKLAYTGNIETAWRFMREAWPADLAGRAAFVGEFTEQLRKSPHWSRLQKWSTAPPPVVEAVDTTSNMR